MKFFLAFAQVRNLVCGRGGVAAYDMTTYIVVLHQVYNVMYMLLGTRLSHLKKVTCNNEKLGGAWEQG